MVEDLLLNAFKVGGLVDFDESKDMPSTSEEKLTTFYSKLVSQFVHPKGLSVCFSEGNKLIECIMVSIFLRFIYLYSIELNPLI